MSFPRCGPVLAGAFVLLLPSLSGAYQPTSATQTLVDQNSGLLPLAQEDRMVALYGVPFAVDADPATDTDAFVAEFLLQNSDALGVDNVVLDLQGKINIRNDKFTIYTYTQKIENLPVHGSVVKIPVLLGPTEKIGYAGMRLVQLPENPLPPDVLSGAGAVAVAVSSPLYAHLTTYTQPDKVIFETEEGTLHRTWRFLGEDDDEAYLFFVDTNSGEIVDVKNRVFEGNVSGTVTGYGTPCYAPGHPTCPNCCPADNPNNSESCPTEMDMRGVEVSIVGGDQTYAAESGDYGFEGLADGVPVTVQSRLIGQWVTVEHVGSAGDALLVSTAGTPPQTGVDLVFNTTDNPDCVPEGEECSAEFCTAQVNAFLGVQGTHDWFKNLQPTAPIDLNLLTKVNSSSYYVQRHLPRGLTAVYNADALGRWMHQ